VTAFESVLDGRTVGLLDRWRKTRSLFLRADTSEAERALSDALEGRWTRAQIYGRARRILIERAAPLLTDLELRLGDHAARVRVAPEDQGQTKWDAIGNLMPLSFACRQIRCLWLVDVLQQGQLYVEFQPIFDLRSGEALGYEGLLRGRSPDGTPHLAEALFPAAHVLGIENAFERMSWAKVLDAGRRLPEDSLLFLNVNPMLLVGSESGLAGLGREAERMEFPYARLALDLVEVERVESLERLSAALDVPHDLGVAIALDDVKSSYGLLKYCAGLTPRWVKVDSEITRGIARDAQRRAILQLLSQVTRGARAGLIAEGIESGEDLDVCVAEGVFAAQGYFLARPSEEPGEATPEFRAWLDSRGGRILPFEAAGASARRALQEAEPEPGSREPQPRSAEAERDFDL
jgi:EAL domain-containing protein (putative c-di-GMP-specific phosphodiesterase class I)